jgi:alkylated DNA repair protein (DNA oxidative demethylase)
LTPAGSRLGPGLLHVPGYLGRAEQEELRDTLRREAVNGPLYRPVMPRTGRPLSVRMTNLGRLGWVTDRERGYRYQAAHPETGQPWGSIPAILLRAWEELAAYPGPPEACLVNVYDPGSKMGLHQDRDEDALDAPVLSLSLGATALFRIGGTDRRDRTRSIRLESGDAFLFGGPARLVFHGIDRIIPGTSTLLPDDRRINCTLRRVTAPA